MYWFIYSTKINFTFPLFNVVTRTLKHMWHKFYFFLDSAGLDGKCNENSEQGRVAGGRGRGAAIPEIFPEKHMVSTSRHVRGGNCT